MDILSEMYFKSVAENERNLRFWEDYLQNLKSLDFSTYSEKLKVPVLVPIGSRILFRGELKHTNEMTVALGADYFVKCSLKQADTLRLHRIKVVQEKVNMYNKEKEYLQNQMSFLKQNVSEDQGQEIIEYHTDEEDKAWRQKHRANVKKYYQNRRSEEVKHGGDIADAELWDRLEELELQEELQNEINSTDNTKLSFTSFNENESYIVKEDKILPIKSSYSNNESEIKDKVAPVGEINNKVVKYDDVQSSEQSLKLRILQQVIDKQNELEEKLHELKNRERSQSKTEKDLLSRLHELEQLDELEDEMDRLEDIIDNEDNNYSEEETPSTSHETRQKSRVSFADEDKSETLEITFKHSQVTPDSSPYDAKNGIKKPSDIYQIHPNLYGKGTTSILKKSKYTTYDELPKIVPKQPLIKVPENEKYDEQNQDHKPVESIVIKDVVEREEPSNTKLLTENKPMSLFKKKRMQNKS